MNVDEAGGRGKDGLALLTSSAAERRGPPLITRESAKDIMVQHTLLTLKRKGKFFLATGSDGCPYGGASEMY